MKAEALRCFLSERDVYGALFWESIAPRFSTEKLRGKFNELQQDVVRLRAVWVSDLDSVPRLLEGWSLKEEVLQLYKGNLGSDSFQVTGA